MWPEVPLRLTPTTADAFDTSYNGGFKDIFFTKLNATGTGLIYSTLMGGNDAETAYRIAIDDSGNTHMVGFTRSTDFPTSPDAFDASHNGPAGGDDAFFAKLDASGALVYSSFFGGASNDAFQDIALHSSGDAYVAGWTVSAAFPTTARALDTTFNGSVDAVVLKISALASNSAPVVAADGPSVTVNESVTTENTGTFSDPDSGDTVTISASVGSVTQSGASNGTWNWSFTTTDGPTQTQTVTITATDNHDASASSTFALTVNNAAPVPSIACLTSIPSVGNSFTCTASATDDSSVDSAAGFAFDWSVTKNGNPHGSGSGPNFTFTFDAAGTYVISLKATDKDGGFGSAQPHTIVIAAPNSAPTVAANSSSVTVNEGSTATNSGTYSHADGDDVALTASNGTVVKTGTNSWSWSLAAADGPHGETVTITATDSHGASTSTNFQLSIQNVAPAVQLSVNANPVPENTSMVLSGSFVDPGMLDSHSVVIDWGDGSPTEALALAAGMLSFSAPHIYLDDIPTGTPSDISPITVTVADKDGGTGTANAPLRVNNIAPTITSFTGPKGPVSVATSVGLAAAFSDPGAADTHTCSFTWDDGTSSVGTVGAGSCTGTHSFASAGVYEVRITITDDDGGSASALFQYVVAYDPSGGFVTGGGWIQSPAGAYIADANLAGKANFGFVPKYHRGASTPSGNTEFQFHAGSFNFHSTEYQWLVVAGHKAQFKGTGTVNGTGNYGFMLTAIDGQQSGGGGIDKFRIKIWDVASDAVVYDNTLLSG